MNRRPVAGGFVCTQAVLTAVLTIFVTSGSTANAQSIPDNGSWSFEESSGTTVIDSTAAHNGTLINGVLRTTNGKKGRGLKFDGANDYVNLQDASALEAQTFSIALWVKRIGTQRDMARVLTKGGTTTNPWASYKIEFIGSNDELIRAQLGFTDGTVGVASGVTRLIDGQWTHVAATFDGTRLSLYVGGVLDAVVTFPQKKTIKFDATVLTLAGTTAWGNFRGELDELRYFARALSAAEIQGVAAQTGSGTPAPTPSSPPPATGSLTVTSPNASVYWAIGTQQPITWTHTLAAGSTSTIELSRDGGATWSLVVSGILNASQTGSYLWTVPGPSTSQARIRVTSSGASDMSNADFYTGLPTITLTSPNAASDVWTVGQTATVTWSSNLGAGENVRLELSRDGGTTYPIVLASSTPSDGSETVAVQGGWSTTTGRVRATWVEDTTTTDTSNASFTITASSSTKTVSFQSTLAEFPNPDRGFYMWTDVGDTTHSYVRAAGVTLTRQFFRLDAYRNTALPAAYLNDVSAQFALARQAGIKVIPRFAYNWGPYPNSAPDASQTRILQHLQQLAPILAANEDVISSFEAGFIGAWGEWHTSTNGLDANPAAKAVILAAILDAVPSSRMVALRYPTDMQLLNGLPISVGEAFSGSDRSRVGSHQDCFLASNDDLGTWGRTGNPYSYDKAYVADNGQFAVVGGETCGWNPPRSNCPTALYELEYMHWSNLNVEYDATVIQGFKSGGCYDEIRRRLGYRYELESATYSTSTKRGGLLRFDFQISNVGYAAMFNARPVFAVLSNGTTSYAAQLNTDPRDWTAGATTTVAGDLAIPTSFPAGTYTLSIWMPDQATSIRNNPLYAVRFANQSTWNATQGWNVVATDVVITP
jgi:hypothetical protein